MTDLRALEKAGFDFTQKPVQPNLIISTQGFAKTGKTDLPCGGDAGQGMPGPILFQSFDLGEDGVVQKAQAKGKQIAVKRYNYEGPRMKMDKGKWTADNNEYTRVSNLCNEQAWEPFIEDLYSALKHGIRSIVWDKATEVYEIQRLAHYGKLTSIGGEEGRKQAFGFMAAEYRKLVRDVKLAGVNLFLIHDVKEVWATRTDPNTGQPKSYSTGKYKAHGFDKLEQLVDAYVEQRYSVPVGGVGGFELEILRCRHNPSVNGEKLTNDQIDFPTLAMMLAPEIDAEAWIDG